MSTIPKNTSDNQEFDLSRISQGIGHVYENFLNWIFRGFLFVKRNIVVLVILFVIGAALGFYMDRSKTVYNHELVVTPNFGSTGYVYSKIELINAKIKEGDTLFLKAIGIKRPKYFSHIEIEPVTDIYNFVNEREQNFAMIKLMAEDSDVSKIITDETTSKNYAHHIIKITTRGKADNKGIVEPLMQFLNQSDYYTILQKSIIESIHRRIAADERTIGQIDSLLSGFSAGTKSIAKSGNLVYYNNENSQLNDILLTKGTLIGELASKRVELLVSDRIVKEKSVVLNIKNTRSLNQKMKFLMPILFIGLFIFFGIVIRFYKSRMSVIDNK